MPSFPTTNKSPGKRRGRKRLVIASIISNPIAIQGKSQAPDTSFCGSLPFVHLNDVQRNRKRRSDDLTLRQIQVPNPCSHSQGGIQLFWGDRIYEVEWKRQVWLRYCAPFQFSGSYIKLQYSSLSRVQNTFGEEIKDSIVTFYICSIISYIPLITKKYIR